MMTEEQEQQQQNCNSNRKTQLNSNSNSKPNAKSPHIIEMQEITPIDSMSLEECSKISSVQTTLMEPQTPQMEPQTPLAGP